MCPAHRHRLTLGCVLLQEKRVTLAMVLFHSKANGFTIETKATLEEKFKWKMFIRLDLMKTLQQWSGASNKYSNELGVVGKQVDPGLKQQQRWSGIRMEDVY